VGEIGNDMVLVNLYHEPLGAPMNELPGGETVFRPGGR
jgi:hypothetical protein